MLVAGREEEEDEEELEETGVEELTRVDEEVVGTLLEEDAAEETSSLFCEEDVSLEVTVWLEDVTAEKELDPRGSPLEETGVLFPVVQPAKSSSAKLRISGFFMPYPPIGIARHYKGDITLFHYLDNFAV